MMSHLRSTLSCLLLFGLWTAPVAGSDSDNQTAETPVSFARQIRPLLSDQCFACHGPDEQTREGGLRLDVREDAMASGVLAPGSPDDSELLRRISLANDDDEKMPPPSFHKELTETEIKLIRDWIEQGAPYQQHWAYRPLERPPIPERTQGGGEIENPIDAFILDQLAEADLGFAPRADRITLIRRLYLDLLGVPPTPQEAQAFLDDTSARAIHRTVDQLLRDPRFGERLAVYWLDLVRYADTIGYHSDNYMEVSAYRDYVIESFNENKPFDQFTIEQLAGDLLPDPSQEQLVASGYNRLLQTTEEGGAQAKEYIAIYAADRVRNLSGVWMGQTVGCAQCHDHKYDPFTMKDFYSLAAFFADIEERAVGKRQPNFTLVTPQQQRQLDALTEKVTELRIDNRLQSDHQLAKAVGEGQAAWERDTSRAIQSDASLWQTVEPVSVEASEGIELQSRDDGSLLSTGENPEIGSYAVSLRSDKPIEAIRLEVLPDPSFPNKKGFSRGNGNFILTEVKVYFEDKQIPIAEAIADYEQKSWPVSDAIDNDNQTGWAIEGHQRPAERRVAVFRLDPESIARGEETFQGDGIWRVELHHDSTKHPRHLIGRFRISVSEYRAAGVDDKVALPETVVAAIKIPAEERSGEQRKTISDYFRSIAPQLAAARRELDVAEKQLESFKSSLQTMLVSKSLDEPRMTRVLPRGNWLDDSGDEVQPSVPAFLPHQPIEGRRATRLDLANWLVSAENPLTARNFVNRLWKLFYGRGLSGNLDDLGGQGEPPTHPELLDWLAVEFRDSGWDVKHVIRLMVTSRTYAQSSVASERARAADPLNRLYSRQGRWRLEAEFVRDSALSISGLLAKDVVGGKSVKPYQPAGYWQHLNFPKREWQADSGAALYRRGVYTFWCRTFLHPSMLAFDAPSREECTAQRSRSNIPQQALVLLNDPIFVEAASVFGERIMLAGEDTESRLTWAIRTAMTREPSAEELRILESLYREQRERYAASPEEARALLQVGHADRATTENVGELAAWSQVARAILNAYETTSRF
jgi:hypothetical protein